MLDPKEDEHNKSYRPIPAKRITRENALILRWALVPACWALSAYYSVETVHASMALCMMIFAYNEMGLAAGHWFGRQAVNAAGTMACEIGACLVAGKHPVSRSEEREGVLTLPSLPGSSGANRHALHRVSFLSVLCSAGIIWTTVQAGDFKDTEGDRLVGRKTLPIVAPKLARPTLMLALLTWSAGLSVLWKLGVGVAIAFNALALIVGTRFVLLDSVKADQRSYYLYNVSVLFRTGEYATHFVMDQGLAFSCAFASCVFAFRRYRFRLISCTGCV